MRIKFSLNISFYRPFFETTVLSPSGHPRFSQEYLSLFLRLKHKTIKDFSMEYLKKDTKKFCFGHYIFLHWCSNEKDLSDPVLKAAKLLLCIYRWSLRETMHRLFIFFFWNHAPFPCFSVSMICGTQSLHHFWVFLQKNE